MSESKRRFLGCLLVAGVLALLMWLVSPTFIGDEVCMRCGITRAFREWQLPFISTPLRRSSRLNENAFSQYVISEGLVPLHEHKWSLIHGSGKVGPHNLSCVLGNGRRSWLALTREETPQLLEEMHRNGFDKERDELLNAILSKDRASVAMTLVVGAASPSTPDEFREWFDDYKDEWNTIRQPSNK